MTKNRFNLRNVAMIIACLAATMFFAACEETDEPNNGYESEFTIPDDGKVPSTVVPDEIRTLFERIMPLHSGKTPPNIKGEYFANSKILTGSNYPPDEIGKSYLNQYIAFTKGADGKIHYDAEEHRFDVPVSDDSSEDVTVYLVGAGNKFTAYFVATGQTYDIYNKESTIISGTLTENGIQDFHLAFVMLEKGADPANRLVPVNTYRIFKENDGLAARYDWLADRENRNAIINAADEAWTNANTNTAYIFLADGSYTQYTFDNNKWLLNGNGSYKINGKSLTLNAVSHPFSINGNSLKITVSGTEYTYTKTKPFSIGFEIDEELILPEGQAWVQNDITLSGYIFKSDGTYSYHWGSNWTPTSSGTWSAKGNTLTIIQTGISPYRYTYSVSGGKLTMTNPFGDVYVYNQMPIPN